ncbi:NAD(P)-binding protein [Rickenella mellea]|uniref:NAD(P)-binding protein n=1 Tax=Rickenella mellea TaxID=50990 RepID=A0A4Y7QDR5_9AGAM|nr:NAD(P)-binding protein [Rickenella mellea]
MTSYVVTGGSRGLGLEYVKQLSEDPKNVVFGLVRNKKRATRLFDLNRQNVHIIEADIVDPEGLQIAAKEVSNVTGGKLDVLINNAAYVLEAERVGLTLSTYPEGKFDVLEKDLKESFNVNVIGVIHTINAFLPLLRAGRAKKVMSLSSGLGDYDFTLKDSFAIHSPYSISKAALNMVVVKYAAELAGEGFVFLAVSPGFVNTQETEPTPKEIESFKGILKKFQVVYPSFEGPTTPESSVRMTLDVLNKSTVDDSGAFLSHYGNKEWL